MLPSLASTAFATITALSLALSTATPAQALGKNERNFLKGVAAALIVGAIIKDAQARPPARQPAPDLRPRPPHDEHRTGGGRIIGSHGSVYATLAAQTFNSYSRSQRQAIQSRLRSFGYYDGGIDGAFGPGTYRAVVAYARDTGGAGQLDSRAGAYGVYDGLLY